MCRTSDVALAPWGCSRAGIGVERQRCGVWNYTFGRFTDGGLDFGVPFLSSQIEFATSVDQLNCCVLPIAAQLPLTGGSALTTQATDGPQRCDAVSRQNRMVASTPARRPPSTGATRIRAEPRVPAN